MKGRFVQFTVVTAAIGMLIAATPAAAPKPKPPADIPGTFTVRTPCYHNEVVDRITGDCGDRYEADTDGTYVILNTNREFRSALYGMRFVLLDFSEPIVESLCTANCFRTFGDIVEPQPNIYPPEGPYRVVMQTNVVDVNGVETPNGLQSIAPGNSSFARFFVSFEDPGGRDFHWSAIFNPLEYPGSDHVTVTREIGPQCTWTIEANTTTTGSNAGARAGLRAWNVKKGRNGNSDEGLFSMPFAIVFTASSCDA